MPGIDAFRREVKNYREYSTSLYDQLEADPASLKNLLALQVDNRAAKENPVRIQEALFFPEAIAWTDQRIAGADLDKINFTVPLAGYDVFIPYNKVNIGRPHTVHKLDQIIPRLPEAWMRKQVGVMMDVFRTNPLAYDGQNFFDTDHTHPAGMGTYSNVTTPNWTTPATPTFAEASAALAEVRAKFAAILSVQAEVLDLSKLSQGLVIIVHNSAHATTFEQLRTLLFVPGTTEPNPWKGGFTLLIDNKPTGGEEDYIEMVMALPGGARPIVLVVDTEPVLDAWETNQIPNGYIAVGLTDGIFGVKPAFPQSAVQVRPT